LSDGQPFELASLERVFVPKASDVLAKQLRDWILDAELADGTPLPPEREIVATSGLSRASVRESLRVLEVEGLVETRPGRNGGTVVRRPGRDALSRSLELFVRSQGVRLQALLEAREALEPPSARFAAIHRTDDDLAGIERAQRACEAALVDTSGFVDANLEWHLAIVQASHNEPLIAFMTAISHAIRGATGGPTLTSPATLQLVVRSHRRVMDAIVARDADAAARRMQRHVSAYAEVARRADPPPAGADADPTAARR
jgi:DNA-binding FadR family transcriptional regulator